MSDGDPLLSVRGLTKHYPITEGLLQREVGRVRAVDGIDFDVHPGETLGLIGESGCGKSTAATSLLRIEEPTDGAIVFDGDDVTSFEGSELKRFRRRAQMIFQNPTSSFDPRMTVGESVAEPLWVHGMTDEQRRRAIAEDLLDRVGLSAENFDQYPHELSGGQKQRAALARALVLDPDLLVADEPVSALDVSVQAEILALLDDLKREFGLSMLLISHDIGVVREVCDRVAVMYLGEIVEYGPTEDLLADPQHPYTEALVASIPTPDPRARGDRGVELTGDVPDPSNPPSGCRFHTRCPSVVQPEGYDLDQAAWRRVMDFRAQLADDAVDPDALRETAAARSGDGDPASVPDGAVGATLREEFDLPADLGDDEATATLDAAVDDVVAGSPGDAERRLAEAFETVCERRDPSLRDTGAGHPAACHLHETDQRAATPEPSDD